MKQKVTALSLAILMAASVGTAVQAAGGQSQLDKDYDCFVLETMSEYSHCMNDAP